MRIAIASSAASCHSRRNKFALPRRSGDKGDVHVEMSHLVGRGIIERKNPAMSAGVVWVEDEVVKDSAMSAGVVWVDDEVVTGLIIRSQL